MLRTLTVIAACAAATLPSAVLANCTDLNAILGSGWIQGVVPNSVLPILKCPVTGGANTLQIAHSKDGKTSWAESTVEFATNANGVAGVSIYLDDANNNSNLASQACQFSATGKGQAILDSFAIPSGQNPPGVAAKLTETVSTATVVRWQGYTTNALSGTVMVCFGIKYSTGTIG